MNKSITLLRTPAVIPSGSLNGSSIVPSLAIAYLSSVLRDNDYIVHDIDAQLKGAGKLNKIPNVNDFVTHGLSDHEILLSIPQDTVILGISVMFSSEWPYVRELIKKIKGKFPDLFIIAGGEHITAVPEFTLKQCPEIDIAILGEGEETIIDIMSAFYSTKKWRDIKGIMFKDDINFIRTEKRRRIKNVDEIPWPSWNDDDLITFFNTKQSHGPYKGRTIPIMASRGCPYDCQFCSNRTMWGNNYWSRNPKDVVDEIAHYIDKYQVDCFEFMDLTVYMKRKWIIDFCNELIDRKINITWQCTGGTRTEAIDEEVILLTKKAGCTYLGFAPESGSEKVLVDIKKKIKLSRMINLFKLMKKHRVGTRANLIIGFPDEKRKDIFATLFLQFKLAFLGVLDAPLFIFTPYPGSAFFELLLSRGVIPNLDKSQTAELDKYFYNLAQDFGTANGVGYNSKIGIKELRFCQTIGMGTFYVMHYLLHPQRLFKFIYNIFTSKKSNSVFEQRLIQNMSFFKKNNN